MFPLDSLLKGLKGDTKKPFDKAWKDYETKLYVFFFSIDICLCCSVVKYLIHMEYIVHGSKNQNDSN